MARRLLACLAALLGLAWIAAPIPALANAPNVEVTITSVGDPVLAPGAPLRVSATVTNHGSDSTTITSASLKAQSRAPISRGELLRFVADGQAALRTVAVDVPDKQSATLAPGAHTDLQFEVQPDKLAWSPNDWGPHGVQVTVVADGQAEMDRSLVVLAPGSVPRVQAGVVVPVVPSASEIAATQPFAVGRNAHGDPQATADRVGALLAAIARPGVTAAVDPLLGRAQGPTAEPEEEPTAGATESAQPVPTASGAAAPHTESASGTVPNQSDAPTGSPNTDSSNVNETARLRASIDAFTRTSGTQTIFQAAGDVDVAALVHAHTAEAAALLNDATDIARTEASARGGRSDITLLAPHPDAEQIQALAKAGTKAVVIGQTDGNPPDSSWWTARAQTQVAAGEGERIAGLVADPDMSAAFAGHVSSGGENLTLDALDSRQLVLALSASSYRERPSDQRAQLITVDRPDSALWGPTAPAAATPGSPLDPTNMGTTISALMSAPWVEPATVSAMLGGSDGAPGSDASSSDTSGSAAPGSTASNSDAPHLTLPDSQPAKGEANANAIQVLHGALRAVEAVDSTTNPPHPFAAVAASSSLRPLGATLRDAPEVRSLVVTKTSRAGAVVSQSVYVRPSSPINVIAENTELPVHVANDLPFAVTVDVHLRARDLRIAAPKVTRVVIPPHSTANAKIPVRASGSGDVTATASVTTPHGDPMGRARDIHVRVRASWENTGLIGGAVLVGLVLVFGLVRSVRGGRRSRSVALDQPPREPDAAPSTFDPQWRKPSDVAQERGGTHAPGEANRESGESSETPAGPPPHRHASPDGDL